MKTITKMVQAVLDRYGQDVTLQFPERAETVRAVIQPATDRGRAHDRMTLLGRVDPGQFLYFGPPAPSPEGALTVSEGGGVTVYRVVRVWVRRLGDEETHAFAVLEKRGPVRSEGGNA